VHIKEDEQELVVKMWRNQAGDLDFSVGDHVAVSDVVVDHFNSQESE